MSEQRDSSGNLVGWQYNVFADDSVESYDANGKLLRIVQRNGWTTTLSYSTATTPVSSYVTGSSIAQPGQLIGVRNQFRRQLQFAYDAQGRIRQLLPPGAVKDAAAGSATSPIRYTYGEAISLGSATPAQSQLTSVTWQDGTVRRYHYEDGRFPQALTGTTDELGVRVVTRIYDAQGRVAEESKAGGVDRLQFSYVAGTAGQGNQTTVTDYSGANGSATSRTYIFQNSSGILRPTAVSAPCSLCGGTLAATVYDANGKPARTTAFDGQVTFYSYDGKSRETERAVFPAAYQTSTTRPALSLATNVVSTQWHATWNLPLQVAEPAKLSVYSYDARGNLTEMNWSATSDATGATKFNAVKAGSSYTTNWVYEAIGLTTNVIERTDQTETGRWTTLYNDAGDATTLKDETNNRLASVTDYDPSGRMLLGVNDAGMKIGWTYGPRGFVSKETVSGQEITFMQNAVGLTTAVKTPDNQTIGYVYDSIHRLTDVKLNGASISPQMLASSDYADTWWKGQWALARQGLAKGIESLLPTALAQGVGPFRLPVPIIPIPGQPAPGQPEFDPRRDMWSLPPMTPADRAARRVAEEMARQCECLPSGGYSKPTYTLVTYAHLLEGGHLSPRFSDKSYFASTERVGQALVDEIVANGRVVSAPAESRVVILANLSRPLDPLGYARDASGNFKPTNRVRLIYEKDNCKSQLRAGLEVVTLYPEK